MALANVLGLHGGCAGGSDPAKGLEEMGARGGEMEWMGIPPLADFQIGMGVVVGEDESAAAPDPGGEGGMDIRGERLLPLVAHDEQAEGIEIAGQTGIFQLDRGDGQAAFEQGHGEAVEVAHVRLARGGVAAVRLRHRHALLA